MIKNGSYVSCARGTYHLLSYRLCDPSHSSTYNLPATILLRPKPQRIYKQKIQFQKNGALIRYWIHIDFGHLDDFNDGKAQNLSRLYC